MDEDILGKKQEVVDFVKEHCNKEISFDDRSFLVDDSVDIYIPELKLAIDYCVLEQHNELHKSKKYHLAKTEACEKLGIHMIHIYEDDWNVKNEIIKSRILNLIKNIPVRIYARKCVVRFLTKKEEKMATPFMNANHMQGSVGAPIKVGLFYNNELISLMTFGSRRVAMGVKKNTDGEFELLRFCNKLNHNVIGGAGKCFKFFMKSHNPRLITTYADRSWSRGELYYNLGFTYLSKTEPNYYYIVDKIRKHRFNFRKDVLISQGFDGTKTEIQIMHDRGLYRIFDSGNLKFEFINKNYIDFS